MSLCLALGCLTAWGRSTLVGTPPIPRPISGTFVGRVLGVEELPALDQSRLVLAMREPSTGRAIKVRVNLPDDLTRGKSGNSLQAGALIRFRARLVPPSPPLLPGGYDFARTAWFVGLSASGRVVDPVEVIEPGDGGGEILAEWRADISRHIRARLANGAAGIAVAFATGDMGAIPASDAQAMRDAGLAHLLSISGLHVSAVIGAVYFLAIRLLALSPAIALRWRLPLVAAGLGAAAGIGYTLLTGSQVPTVRSCAGSLLVLGALLLGREALSVRMLATGAFLVMLLWPEAIVGPSFQMSFAAVLTLIVVANAAPVRRWMAPRDESMPMRTLRALGLMLLIGIAIDLVLMPIAFYHFHRAGMYGALANLVAIPLTTFVVMPLVALALVLDLVGLGAPLWWLGGHAIDLLLDIAHAVSSFPGAVRLMPLMGTGHFLLFVIGGLWLALWSGRIRLLGLVPALAGVLGLMFVKAPDLLVSGDGHYVAMTVEDGTRLAMLRESSSGTYAVDNLMEVAGQRQSPVQLAVQRQARCNRDFCAATLQRGGRTWHILIARSDAYVPVPSLLKACRTSDIVIADRTLPQGCRPGWLRIDRRMLRQTGGVAIDLDRGALRTVAQGQGSHGWWRP